MLFLHSATELTEHPEVIIFTKYFEVLKYWVWVCPVCFVSDRLRCLIWLYIRAVFTHTVPQTVSGFMNVVSSLPDEALCSTFLSLSRFLSPCECLSCVMPSHKPQAPQLVPISGSNSKYIRHPPTKTRCTKVFCRALWHLHTTVCVLPPPSLGCTAYVYPFPPHLLPLCETVVSTFI